MTIRPIILLFLKNKGLACEEDSVFKHSTCVNKTIRQADGRGEGGGGSTVCRKKSGRVLLMMESWMDGWRWNADERVCMATRKDTDSICNELIWFACGWPGTL